MSSSSANNPNLESMSVQTMRLVATPRALVLQVAGGGRVPLPAPAPAAGGPPVATLVVRLPAAACTGGGLATGHDAAPAGTGASASLAQSSDSAGSISNERFESSRFELAYAATLTATGVALLPLGTGQQLLAVYSLDCSDAVRAPAPVGRLSSLCRLRDLSRPSTFVAC